MVIEIEGEDGKTASLRIPAKAHDLSQRAAIVETFIHAFAPLRREGIDSVRIGNLDGSSEVKVVWNDMAKFVVLGADGMNVEVSMRSYVIDCTIVRLSLQEGRKVASTGRGMEFSASMEDARFIGMVENNRQFARGDVLTYEIEQTETMTNGKRTAEYASKRVQEHTQEPAMNPDLSFSHDE